MNKIKKHIEIVSSTIPGLSSMSEPSRKNAEKVLSRHFTAVTISIINDLDDLEALVARAPDLVFLGMKFLPENPIGNWKDSPKVWLSEYLDEAGIAYTGSSQTAHELERYKPLAKRCVTDAGGKSASFTVIKRSDTFTEKDIDIPYPLFIKPTNSGGGTGIDEHSLVHNFTDLKMKVSSIANNENADSLIETYLSGREFSVAILASGITNTLSAMPIELEASQNAEGERVLSQLVKSLNEEVVSAVPEGAIRDKVVGLAIQAFRALGARDYGRIDIRLDNKDIPHFLEANLIPSLIDGYGSFPKACSINKSMSYEEMLLHIVHLALRRSTESEMVTVDTMSATLLPAHS